MISMTSISFRCGLIDPEESFKMLGCTENMAKMLAKSIEKHAREEGFNEKDVTKDLGEILGGETPVSKTPVSEDKRIRAEKIIEKIHQKREGTK